MDIFKKAKRDYLIAMLIVGCIAILIFGFINAFVGRCLLGIIDIALGFFGLFLLIFLFKNKKVDFISRIVIIIVFALFIYVFLIGGYSHYEVLWLFAFPLVCFHIESGKKAIILISLFLVVIFSLSILHFFKVLRLPYQNDFLVIFLSVLTVFSAFLYFSDRIKNNVEILIREKDETISKDLKMARIIQENILSNDGALEEKLDIELYFKPMFEVGGDIYDIFYLRKNYYRVLVADAAGHGVQAALVTMIIKSDYDKIKYFDMPPNIVLKLFNNEFVGDKKGLTIFFNCAIIDIDLNNDKLHYSAAGHPYQFFCDNNGIHVLKSGDFMIGIVRDKDFETYTYDFKTGDKILLFTDGIFEINNKEKAEIKVDTIEKIFEQNRKNNMKNIVEEVKYAHLKWKKNERVTDDITILGIERK